MPFWALQGAPGWLLPHLQLPEGQAVRPRPYFWGRATGGRALWASPSFSKSGTQKGFSGSHCCCSDDCLLQSGAWYALDCNVHIQGAVVKVLSIQVHGAALLQLLVRTWETRPKKREKRGKKQKGVRKREQKGAKTENQKADGEAGQRKKKKCRGWGEQREKTPLEGKNKFSLWEVWYPSCFLFYKTERAPEIQCEDSQNEPRMRMLWLEAARFDGGSSRSSRLASLRTTERTATP